LGDIPDALCLTIDLFGFSNFMMIYVDEPQLIFKLLDFFQERITSYLEQILSKGASTLYRIVGPEYATPPYFSPADGDIEISEAREILGKNIVLFGNIEERLFEVGTKEDIRREVKKTIEAGKKAGNFVLCPTAMPLNTPLDNRIKDNIKYYIDFGLEFGKY